VISSIACIPYYGPAPLAHHLAVRASGVKLAILDGDACVDAARAILLEHALRSDAEVFVFIDSDMVFRRPDYERMVEAAHYLGGIVAGAYALKDGSGQPTSAFGESFDIPGVFYATRVALGFTAIPRSAVLRMTERSGLGKVEIPLNQKDSILAAPLFMPMIHLGRYLREDYAFSQRAIDAGVHLFVDTRTELTHIGSQGFQCAASALPPPPT
jgi:hypothetical protein